MCKFAPIIWNISLLDIKQYMELKMNDLGNLFRTTATEWYAKDPFKQSAVIAYYAIFSIPGLLFLLITITGYFLDREAVTQSIVEQVSTTMGAETAAQIEGMLTTGIKTKPNMWASIAGFAILLIGATGVFVELQKTLNNIWHVEVVVKKGIWPILKARLFSFGLIVTIAFLLLISLVVSTALAALSEWVNFGTSALMVQVFSVINFIFSLAVISVLFALMFKILPDAKIQWKHVWFGGLVTGSLFTIGKTALAFYFGKAQPASAYGAAGSIILILLWVSYSSMIMFFGAEFTASYARLYTGVVAPSAIAKKETPTK